jgi:hypothetical protein
MRGIPGHAGYWASCNCVIYSNKGPNGQKPGKMIRKKSRVQNSGYDYVSIVVMCNGKRLPKRLSVHRLVALAWLGQPPKDTSEVRHINGRGRDNRPENLRYGSKESNFRDRIKHEPQIKLDYIRVREIRLLLQKGIAFSEIARLYGVCYHSVYLIAQGLTWRRQACGLTPSFRQWQRDNLDWEHRHPPDAVERLKRGSLAS